MYKQKSYGKRKLRIRSREGTKRPKAHPDAPAPGKVEPARSAIYANVKKAEQLDKTVRPESRRPLKQIRMTKGGSIGQMIGIERGAGRRLSTSAISPREE